LAEIILTYVVSSAYTPAELEDMADLSNRPYEDDRGKAERDKYAESQRKNRERNRDLREWQRLKLVLGNDKLPNFSGFRSMVRNNSERLKRIRTDFNLQQQLKAHPELVLPNSDKAVIDNRKFTGYFFNPNSQRGFAKGVAFTRHLGYNMTNWEKMRDEIMSKRDLYPVTFRGENESGKHYRQIAVLYGETNNPMVVRINWTQNNEGMHFVTAMPH
jgi:hypothetical protein